MDTRRLVARYPVHLALTAAALLALVRAGLLLGGDGSPGVRIRAVALAVVLVGFATAFWLRPIAERTSGD